MLAIDRRKKIMTILQEKNSVLVPELSRLFDVTEETIRRDLEKLENQGLLKRTYGGAVISDNANIDVPLTIREVTNIEGKQSIGLKVAEFIEDGDTIMLDSSSTALQVAKQIKNKRNLTIITNSEKVVLELANARDCKIISTGGTFKNNSLSYVGHWAERAVQNYNADKTIISCKGLNMEKGITDSNELEAEVKKAMINSSDKVFLVADHTKFDRTSFVKMMGFEKVDMVFTDKKLPSEWEELLKGYNIKLIYS